MTHPVRAQRVYVPATLSELARLLDEGSLTIAEAVAVTDEFRLTLPSEDDEGCENEALLEAADRSGLLHVGSASTRRVVLAADVPESDVVPDPSPGSAAVRLRRPLTAAQLVSVHIDELGGGEDPDLLWYDASEARALLGE